MAPLHSATTIQFHYTLCTNQGLEIPPSARDVHPLRSRLAEGPGPRPESSPRCPPRPGRSAPPRAAGPPGIVAPVARAPHGPLGVHDRRRGQDDLHRSARSPQKGGMRQPRVRDDENRQRR
jgi:hypothetical protein